MMGVKMYTTKKFSYDVLCDKLGITDDIVCVISNQFTNEIEITTTESNSLKTEEDIQDEYTRTLQEDIKELNKPLVFNIGEHSYTVTWEDL